jgi:hypothetical protein
VAEGALLRREVEMHRLGSSGVRRVETGRR